ncbi:hypothetical protein [Frigoriflavimonas asaccharolytica]|uniref:MG2 domain-containing protein n=1 Tax=Frigoriflavimonas asaccharolytica TaxID=2735899 RepID=A0A8J8G794_9FLAO|nr:hypothetical protein [Frigoriflavimonas asaccharolytica]NRS91272.1 hypothetical protein [Frigoriflavimonas asaccharolytica]
MLKNLSLLLFLFSTIFCNSFAQNSPEEAISKFSEEYPQEKIHLLLNKKSFIAGESIFFKGMIVDGFKPSLISTSLFVELYDKNKKLISRKTVPILLGEALGNIQIAADMKEDVYFLRAYTTWSTNFNENFQWIKAIPIYNEKSAEKLEINKNSEWNVSIQPESGRFLNGINTKVSVRMKSKGILPSTWSGFVVEENNLNLKLAEFKSLDENVATFNITPEIGKKYKLIVQDINGNKKDFDFPITFGSGIQLKVKSETGTITLTPQFHKLEKPSAYYKIVGQINNRLVYIAKLSTLSSGSTYKIPTESLVNGILQLVILNDKNEVLAERLCFVDGEKLNIGKIDIASSGLKTGAKSLNSINIPTKSDFANFTALVADNFAESTEDENSLLSTIFLTGDIGSEISNPAQYFTSSRNLDALDALLISEKWERFNWRDILIGNFPKIMNKPNSYITYTGKASMDGTPVKNTTMNLVFSTKGSGTEFFQSKTDENGIFVLDNLIFEEPFEITYSIDGVVKSKDQNVTVYFQSKVNPAVMRSALPKNSYLLSEKSIDEAPSPEVKRAMQEITFNKNFKEKIALIEEVKIKFSQRDKTDNLNKKLSSPNFKGINETVFDFVNDYKSSQRDILSWLEGRVSGLKITQGSTVSKTGTIRGENFEIFVNENPQDISFVSTLNLSDVAMIKVIKPPFRGRSNSVISIYLKEGINNVGQKGGFPVGMPGLGSKTITGYDKNDPYPFIDYEKTPEQKSISDNRITLYWNPYVQSSTYESGSIKFYNNDVAKSYNITIFGYDYDLEKYVYFHEVVTP